MTQTQDFMTQLSEFINTDEGLKQALQLIKVITGLLFPQLKKHKTFAYHITSTI